MHDQVKTKGDISQFEEISLRVVESGAAQNDCVTLKKLSKLEERYPQLVGKSKTCRTGKRFSMSVFQDAEARQSSITFLGLLSLMILVSVTISVAYSSESNIPIEPRALPGKLLKTIIISDYYPYTFVNERELPDGFSVDVAKAVVQVMDMKLEISVDTWEHAREALEKGTIDFLPMMASSPLRRRSFDFSVPHTIAYDAVFVRRGTHRIGSLNDLAGKTLIVMNKDAAHDFLLTTSISDTIKLILVNSLADGLRLLASGKGDAAIMPELVGLLLVKKLNITNIEDSPVTIESYNRSFSFAVKKGNKAVLEALSQGLSIVDANGQYRDIYHKWFGVLAPSGLPWKSVLKYIAGIVAVSALIGMTLLFWSLSLRKMVTQRTMALESEILERKKTETALRQSEERYRGVFENAAIGIDLVDAKGRFLQVNRSLAQMLGYSQDELLNRAIRDVTHPEDLEISKIKHERMVNGETDSYRFEKRYVRKDGDVLWADVSVSPVRGPDGVHLATVGAIADITDRKKAEEALRKSENVLNNIIEQSPFSMWISDAEGTLQRINKACKKWTRSTDDEVVGRYNVLKDEAVEEQGLMPLVRSVFQEGKTVNFELTWDSSLLKHIERAEITQLILDVTMFPVNDHEGTITNAVCQHIDITDRKKAQGALRQEQIFKAALLENMVDGVVACDADFKLTLFNKTARQWHGLDPMSIPAEKWAEYYDLYCADGVTPMTVATVPLARAFRGEVLHNAGMVIRAKAQHERHILSNCAPFFDEEGTKLGAVAVMHDITEIKQAEDKIRKLNVELEQRVRDRTAQLEAANEELKAFAYSVSHDLKAPLRAISGFAHIIATRYRPDLNEEGRHYFDNIVKASSQMDSLISDLLTYSRIGRHAVKRDPVDLGEVVSQSIVCLKDRIHERGAEVIVEGDFPVLRGDPSLIERILINLLDNALTYIREGVSPRIIVRGQSEADGLIIRVSDNGIGIAPEFQDKIFQIFQRLHSQDRYPGTGIGLSVVKKSVGLLGGTVSVESTVGEGTSFSIRLPRENRTSAENMQRGYENE